MVTNKLNNYIGFLAFAIFWLIFIFSKLLEWNVLVSIPLLAICMLIQITALWMPDAIYIPIKFLGMTSERLFIENLKEGDEFITDFGVRYIALPLFLVVDEYGDSGCSGWTLKTSQRS